MTFIASAVSAVLCEEVALVFQMQQSPVVMVATQYDASSVSSVTTVRSAVRVVFYMA
jgi:hypothetical protein